MVRSPVVLITGTSSGFGYYTSLVLAKEGYTVIATMRNMERKMDLARAAKQAGVSEQIHFFSTRFDGLTIY